MSFSFQNGLFSRTCLFFWWSFYLHANIGRWVVCWKMAIETIYCTDKGGIWFCTLFGKRAMVDFWPSAVTETVDASRACLSYLRSEGFDLTQKALQGSSWHCGRVLCYCERSNSCVCGLKMTHWKNYDGHAELWLHYSRSPMFLILSLLVTYPNSSLEEYFVTWTSWTSTRLGSRSTGYVSSDVNTAILVGGNRHNHLFHGVRGTKTCCFVSTWLGLVWCGSARLRSVQFRSVGACLTDSRGSPLSIVSQYWR